MSWTDIYPILQEEQVQEFIDCCGDVEAKILDEWFSVEETFNARKGAHIVAVSLFWKNARVDDGELPPLSRDILVNAERYGLVNRYRPWEHYVKPLLEGARLLTESRPDVVLRIYLANDLRFLIPELVAAGCEVKLMVGSSIRHNPGALWRFLALEEKDVYVTVTDADRAIHVLSDILRTEEIVANGLGLWRVPYMPGAIKTGNPAFYRPIIASNFGAL